VSIKNVGSHISCIGNYTPGISHQFRGRVDDQMLAILFGIFSRRKTEIITPVGNRFRSYYFYSVVIYIACKFNEENTDVSLTNLL
jgi:hypothetical protein